jgi:hypothetical protein
MASVFLKPSRLSPQAEDELDSMSETCASRSRRAEPRHAEGRPIASSAPR